MICNACRTKNNLALIVAHGDGLPILTRCEMCQNMFAFQKTHGLDYRNLLPKNRKQRVERPVFNQDYKDDWQDVNDYEERELRFD